MNRLSSHFAAPVLLAVLSLLPGCSSDAPAPAATAGSSAGGAASGGKGGSAGSSGGSVSVGGSSAGSVSTGGSSAGSVSAGGSGGASGGSGGAGTAGGATVEASFATVKTLIGTSCIGGNGCHGQEGNPLEMTADGTLYATVIGHTTANCGKLINTASPADSALVKLLLADCGTPPGMITRRMPYQKCWDGDSPADNVDCVPPATVAAIQAWIAKGAPQ